MHWTRDVVRRNLWILFPTFYFSLGTPCAGEACGRFQKGVPQVRSVIRHRYIAFVKLAIFVLGQYISEQSLIDIYVDIYIYIYIYIYIHIVFRKTLYIMYILYIHNVYIIYIISLYVGQVSIDYCYNGIA